MHEHIARTMYYVSIHLLYASLVASAAWALTSAFGASATTKYWIWVATACNFALPLGAIIDKMWVLHLTWATPLGAIGGPIWDATEGRRAVVLGLVWTAGALFMLARLILRLRKEWRAIRATADSLNQDAPGFVTEGIPVSFTPGHESPAVRGVLNPCIVLPGNLDRLLDQREFNAVLLHELAHAKRRDNLIRLLYEVALCVLWFHPLVWLAGAQMALYRELSCDESVIRRAHGPALVSALAKLAICEQETLFLQATASSHLNHRLAGLAGPAATNWTPNLLVTASFTAVTAAGIYGTIAHTACCFLLKR